VTASRPAKHQQQQQQHQAEPHQQEGGVTISHDDWSPAAKPASAAPRDVKRINQHAER